MRWLLTRLLKIKSFIFIAVSSYSLQCNELGLLTTKKIIIKLIIFLLLWVVNLNRNLKHYFIFGFAVSKYWFCAIWFLVV